MRATALSNAGVLALTLVTATLAVAALLSSCQQRTTGPAADKASLREHLVAAARASGVSDTRVLKALRAVPREQFVPAAERIHAYEDRPLQIGRGQTISQPSLVALMTQLLKITSGDKVLEIGTGSGYQAAILAELTPNVYSIEIIPELASTARARLRRLGFTGVKVRTGDGYQGWPEHAPFDAIIVTCAPDHVPRPLVQQLRDDGRMVIPVGPEGGPQMLHLLSKRNGRLISTKVIPVQFVPLVH
jgi:protein-L-isoaspartate(D-aspartate) O-methyltransferase